MQIQTTSEISLLINRTRRQTYDVTESGFNSPTDLQSGSCCSCQVGPPGPPGPQGRDGRPGLVNNINYF